MTMERLHRITLMGLLLLASLAFSAPAFAEGVTKREGGMADTPQVNGCVDLNRADSEELQRIIHIGPDRAKKIIDGRPWGDVGELQRIKGIGPKRLHEIKEQGLVCR